MSNQDTPHQRNVNPSPTNYSFPASPASITSSFPSLPSLNSNDFNNHYIPNPNPLLYSDLGDLPAPLNPPPPVTWSIDRTANPNPNPPLDGLAYQVHNVFDNIRDNLSEISKTLGNPTMDFNTFNLYFKITPDQFINYLLRHVFNVFINTKTLLSKQRETYTHKVSKVLNKLYHARVHNMTESHIKTMFIATQFVLRQSIVYQQHYFDCFLEDTYNAYDGDENMDNISCPKGIYERFLFAIADACILYCIEFKKKRKKNNSKKRKRSTITPPQNSKHNATLGGQKSMYNTCDKPKYIKLIRLFKKEVPDMNELAKEWSHIFEEDQGKTMTPEQLKSHFIEFMNRTYKRYGISKRKEIEEYAKNIEYAFTNREFG